MKTESIKSPLFANIAAFKMGAKSRATLNKEVKLLASIRLADGEKVKSNKKDYNLSFLLLMYRANVNKHFTEFELQHYSPDSINSVIARAIWDNNASILNNLNKDSAAKKAKQLSGCIHKILDIGQRAIRKIAQDYLAHSL